MSNFAVLPRISLGFWKHGDHQVDNLQDMVDQMQEHIHASIVPEQEIMGEKGWTDMARYFLKMLDR